MAKKRRRLNLDIGWGGNPVRGTTIGIDLDKSFEEGEYTGGSDYGRSETEPLDEIRGNAYLLPFKTESLDRTTSFFPHGIMAFPDEGYTQFKSRKMYPYPEDFDPEEHWQALIESLRVLKPGGTTRHVWDNMNMPYSTPLEVRKDPYYLTLIQLLKNHDMENIKIKIEDAGISGYEDDIPQYHYAFILTARKKR